MLRDYQKDLYHKTMQAFYSGKRRPLVVAPCGAGKSYIFMELAKHTRGPVLILTHRRELLEQHQRLLKTNGVKNARVEMVFTEANRLGERTRPKLIVLDEAHLSRSNTWMKVIDYYNTLVTGFTATPIRLDGKPLGDIYDTLIQGVGVKWLIEHDHLSPFDYYAPMTVDMAEARKIHGDFVVKDIEEIMMNRDIYGDILESYRLIAPEEKAIAYCVSIKHAQQVAQMFHTAGINAAVLSADTPPKQRKYIMDQFRNGTYRILCNVGIISEGISIDDVTCCLLLRPTESHALYWQQAMRCMRYKYGKTAKIIDYVGNYTRNPMPDDDVTWRIDATPAKPPRINSQGDFTVRVCPNCFRTFKTSNQCPYCGALYPLHEREIKAHAEIALAKITAEEKEKIAQEKKRLRQEVGRAKTYQELMQIANQRGYKPAWARMMMKVRNR